MATPDKRSAKTVLHVIAECALVDDFAYITRHFQSQSEKLAGAACCAARLRLFFFVFVFSRGLGRLRSGLLGRSMRGSEAGRSDPGDQYEDLRRDVLK